MVISTRGRYALRLLLDLAEHADEGFVSLKDIAERQDISLKYVEQLMPQLIAAGMLDTARGKSGGYRLSRPVGEYSLGEILNDDDAARKLAEQILPLPCDQRYGAEEMDAVAEALLSRL